MKRDGILKIKIFIIGILIACSYLIGEYIYKAYTKRHKEVNDLIRILELIRMDLSFGLYTLEEIFNRLGEKKEFCTTNFFKSLEHQLHNNTYKIYYIFVLDINKKTTTSAWFFAFSGLCYWVVYE